MPFTLPAFLEPFALGLTFVSMCVGLLFSLVPGVPGAWLIWATALGYGLLRALFGQPLFDGWVGGVAMVLLTILAIADLGLEIVVTNYAAKKEGVSGWALLASAVLGVVGAFVLPPAGPIIGAIGGLFAVEYYRNGQNWRKAALGLVSMAKGMVWSMVAEFVLCVAMMGIWVAWVALAAIT